MGPIPDHSRIWMPCSGPGDMAHAMVEHWPVNRIDAVDDDAAMVRAWADRFPGISPVIHGKGEHVRFDPNLTYSVADIDTFSTPYKMAELFLKRATLSESCLIVLTDGAFMQRGVNRSTYLFDKHYFTKDSTASSDQHKNLPNLVLKWLRTLSNCDVTLIASKFSKPCWYMAYILGPVPHSQPASPPAVDIKATPLKSRAPGGWVRLSGEPPRAFAGFRAYCELGARRSIPDAIHASTGSLPSVSQISQWKTWSAKYKWVSRSLARDEWLARTADEQIVANLAACKLLLSEKAQDFMGSEDSVDFLRASRALALHFPPVQRVADVSDQFEDLQDMSDEALKKMREIRDADRKDRNELSKK